MDLLLRWNQAHNLTSVTDPGDIVTKHFLDSLTIAPLMRGDRFLDIGSGGGFPGIPLALARPDAHWTLIDSRGKRTRFLQEVVRRLGLEQADVVKQRVESYQPDKKFDTLVARAVGPLPRLVLLTQHLWHEGVRVIVMKGADFFGELKEVPTSFREKAEIIPLLVPGTTLNRQAVVFQN